MTLAPSKLTLSGNRVVIDANEAVERLNGIFVNAGCSNGTAQSVSEHLVDSNLSGVESHGIVRVLQYVDQFESGYMRPDAAPRVTVSDSGLHAIDGCDGIGIPAMHLAVRIACDLAGQTGMSAVPIRSVGHTGRLGAFAEAAANEGFLTITVGGGNRKIYRMVAPHGGRRPMLPTNPYCIGIPGGDRGPVVLDFATSKIAGGWIYAARSAGAELPEGSIIDPDGMPTTDPEDYVRGGAILPAGGAKGYALSVVAELIAEAMIGPATTECNWLMITLDTRRYRKPTELQHVAEEILSELRDCPPAPGFEKVEVPGERERDQRAASNGKIAVPEQTWQQIIDLADRLAANAAA